MTFMKGRSCRLEISTGFAAAVTLAAAEITKANPAVLNHTGHGLTVGQVAMLRNVVGMDEINYQAIRVAAAGFTADVATLEKLNSTDYGDFTSGELAEVSTWGTLSQATKFGMSGGDGQEQDITVLLDYQDQVEFAGLNKRSLSIDMYADPWSPEVEKLTEYAESGAFLVYRATWFKMAVPRVALWAGQASVPTFDQDVKSVARGTFTGSIKGKVLWL